ncbi:MAG: MATE family efflux transporter [Epsilonproteobacteria bacterium]|nr:MATE family efflux transporter [Campylobacterota bacterium]PIP10879.1 MAG: MATE family efflux transporter [Sulfurimonas sp. CG23_combo_of_CG06-09_8_20_14_all_36_33]PIS26738.1 MAG: MATE family efflux transporter [Sulfurimonas sp. CG08_land_8_20_14_0_20_36_33]PIU35056.1 MAG: MATE family efflux transporter [Sulfurimonas sp. CG07_land_8_20_14_0_80_36_56]PIV03301.1 MAG: MATE family efflux transporter [Sulfurimonas sp. CG03_land_8_20_14_0_80_36_25]PIV36524.1 MAG: MATE family efflux transporter [S
MPAALKHLVDILQILIDMLMVGMVSVYALAAVGMSMQFMMIINVLMTLYVVGGNALISRFIGQRREKRASALLFSLGIFAIVLSVFVSIGGYFGSELIYSMMGAEAEVVHQGALYFKILACGIVVIFIDTLLYNALSAAGDTKSSLYIKLFSAALNAFLNYVFIFGHYGFEAMGIEGAAYATVIAYTFNVIAYLLLLKIPPSTKEGRRAKLTFIPIIRIKDLIRAWHIGWSAALDRGISSISFLFFVSIIAAYGTAELAGYQVGLRIEGIAFMPGFGFAIAAMALVGQNLGANDKKKAYDMGIISGRVAYMFMGSVGIFLIFFPEFLAGFFTQDAATIAVVSQYLILVGLAQIPLAIVFVYSSALRGAGATKITLYINVLSLWFLRVIPSYIAYKLGFGIIAIFVIMNVETLIKGVLFWYIYQKRSWLDIKV